MSNSLAETGERLHLLGTPRTSDEWAHLERYEWAKDRVRGRVLDVASGTGYGTAILSSRAQAVGVELEVDAIGFALAHHGVGRPFIACRLPSLAFADESFDCVVSFETIEHIEDDIGFLVEVRRVLGLGGVLLLSTPNKAFSSPNGPPANPFHVREYLLEDLTAMLDKSGFQDVQLYAQYQEPRTLRGWVARRALGVAARLGRNVGTPRLDRSGHGGPEVTDPEPRATATFWVVACTAGHR